MDRRVVLLALAVLLAGCGAFAGGSGPRGTEPATLTPAPVPEVTEQRETPTMPPGVTGDSVPNANALFGSHRTTLEGETYTLYIDVRTGDSRSTWLFRIGEGERYYRHDVIGGYNQNITTFSDGEHVYLRSTLGNATQYTRGNTTDRPSSHTVRLANVFLRLDEAFVGETLVDDELHYEISGTYDTHPVVSSFDNFSIHAVVSPDGLIRSMNTSYTVRETTGTTNVTRNFAYSDVGTTRVERPEWVTREWDDHENETRAAP